MERKHIDTLIPDTLDIVICPECGLRTYWLTEGGAHEKPRSRKLLPEGGVGPGEFCPGSPVTVRYVRLTDERRKGSS